MNPSTNLLDEALGLMAAGYAGGALARGRVVLVEDCVETSGAFVLHHLVKRALSPEHGGSVLFLALSHPFSHYDRILRKQGCNLSMHRQQNRFHFIDLLKMEFPDEAQKNGIEDGFVELYSKILRAVEVKSSGDDRRAHISIMIDDLSILEIAAHGSMDHVLDFLHYCFTLTSEQDCSLVILNHEDVYLEMESPRLLSHLIYPADFIIKVEPLVTGISADVHGQLTILKKGVFNDGQYTDRASNFHIQVKENGVELFFPGSRR
ncbi:elongator complex protein 6 [Phalaenopsis equestris]|uniref:elongator complex protein 6 n=1 Tax=Phalaenopsis equestris TaxID=78828 RepID=UPI0009E4783F|nr:elongator complex protein 6 [Phalaenopsis equestris]XP_020588327.1 elongator complex protein 6 [Phalaenopsis equestris]XP_020588339.1 elongator complex protein 6 [Phalaenopsis equestris]XP_020588348.1 elongator complex protein 6 [Phalaenopsis equestris]